MAITSRGLITPEQTDPYNLVADLNTFSASVNEALEDGANTYRGTSAARTSFTSSAPEGTIWVDTNGEKIVWVKQGISWNRIWPEVPIADTGWLACTYQSGFTSTTTGQLQARQVGNQVWVVGGANGTFLPRTYTHVATLPSAISPPGDSGSWVRGGAGGQQGRGALYEIGANRNINFNHDNSTNPAWIALNATYWA